jgi:hypothetical protein
MLTSLDLQDYEINQFAGRLPLRSPWLICTFFASAPIFPAESQGKNPKKIASFMRKRKAKGGAALEAK